MLYVYVICYMSYVTCHMLYVYDICYMLYVICYMLYVICYLLSVKSYMVYESYDHEKRNMSMSASKSKPEAATCNAGHPWFERTRAPTRLWPWELPMSWV